MKERSEIPPPTLNSNQKYLTGVARTKHTCNSPVPIWTSSIRTTLFSPQKSPTFSSCTIQSASRQSLSSPFSRILQLVHHNRAGKLILQASLIISLVASLESLVQDQGTTHHDFTPFYIGTKHRRQADSYVCHLSFCFCRFVLKSQPPCVRGSELCYHSLHHLITPE